MPVSHRRDLKTAAERRRLKVVHFPSLDPIEYLKPWLEGRLDLDVMWLLNPDFCQYLRTLRQRQGLSMRQAAEQIGVSQAQYSRVEAGERNPTEDFVRRAAEALDWDLAELLDLAGFMVLLPDDEAVAAMTAVDRDFENMLFQPEIRPARITNEEAALFSPRHREIYVDSVKRILAHERAGGSFEFEQGEEE